LDRLNKIEETTANINKGIKGMLGDDPEDS
jgi:hypothetical protein